MESESNRKRGRTRGEPKGRVLLKKNQLSGKKNCRKRDSDEGKLDAKNNLKMGGGEDQKGKKRG